MAILPADGFWSDNARTEAEMQTAFDTIQDILAELGSAAATTVTLNADALAEPTSRMVLVKAQTTPDTLDTIDVATVDDGRFVLLRNDDTTTTTTSGARITIDHREGGATGEIRLVGNADFVLSGERMIMLVLDASKAYWTECWRNYGRKNAEDIIAERAFLGLGSAAVVDTATGVGASSRDKVLLTVVSGDDLSDGDLLAVDASGRIVPGTSSGGDADTLDTLDSTAFVRTNATTVQSIDASLVLDSGGDTALTINSSHAATGTPKLIISDKGKERGVLFHAMNTDFLELRSRAPADGAYTSSIRMKEDTLEYATDAETWESLRPGTGNGLNADKLDGMHLADILSAVSLGTRIGMGGDGQDNIGSFTLSDGPTKILVQWGWTIEISHPNGSAPDATDFYTYPEEFSTSPFVLMAGITDGDWLGYSTDTAGGVFSGKKAGYSTTATILTNRVRGTGQGGGTVTCTMLASPWIAIGEPA